MKTLTITLTLLILLALPATVAADGPPQYSGYVPKDAETEYYDGVRDACLYALLRSGVKQLDAIWQCLTFTEIARASDWYNRPPVDWRGMQQRPAGWGNET